jgi:AmmeMemoRadiSam system protein B
VAGYAFATVRGREPVLVAVLSPMHQYHPDSLLTTAHGAYETPLGQIPVNQEALEVLDSRLKKRLGYGLTPVAYDQEHSLEIELPFLQRALSSDFKLLPVMVRAHSLQVSEQLGIALAEVLYGKNALLVASTDLSHYYSRKQADAFDSEMLRRVEAFSPEDIFRAEMENKGFACGLGALTAVLWAARDLGADMVKVVRHATSGDVTGDYSSVVGYGAAVVLKTK